MEIKTLYLLICLIFFFIPFNDVPNIKVAGGEFPFTFFLNFIFLGIYFFKKRNKKIKKEVMPIVILYVYVIVVNFCGITLAKNLEESFFQIRAIIFSSVYLLSSIFIYDVLSELTEITLKKIFDFSIYSFLITGAIEFINYFFKFYERDLKTTGNILRLSPLSSESAYYIITVCIPFSMVLFLKNYRLKKIILSIFIFMSYSTTGVVVLAVDYFFLGLKNIKKTFLVVFVILFLIFSINTKITTVIKLEIIQQTNKVFIYLKNDKKSVNYSANIRNTSKQKLGKDVFYLNPLFGKGSGYIYIYGKKNKIQIEGNYIKDAQNFYWTILAQEGLVGFFIYLIFFLWIDYKIIMYLLKNKKDGMAFGFFCGFQIFLILLNSGNNIWNQSLWMYLVYILAWMKIKVRGEKKEDYENIKKIYL